MWLFHYNMSYEISMDYYYFFLIRTHYTLHAITYIMFLYRFTISVYWRHCDALHKCTFWLEKRKYTILFRTNCFIRLQILLLSLHHNIIISNHNDTNNLNWNRIRSPGRNFTPRRRWPRSPKVHNTFPFFPDPKTVNIVV